MISVDSKPLVLAAAAGGGALALAAATAATMSSALTVATTLVWLGLICGLRLAVSVTGLRLPGPFEAT